MRSGSDQAGRCVRARSDRVASRDRDCVVAALLAMTKTSAVIAVPGRPALARRSGGKRSRRRCANLIESCAKPDPPRRAIVQERRTAPARLFCLDFDEFLTGFGRDRITRLAAILDVRRDGFADIRQRLGPDIALTDASRQGRDTDDVGRDSAPARQATAPMPFARRVLPVAALPARAAAAGHQFDDRRRAERRSHCVSWLRCGRQRQRHQAHEHCSKGPHFILGEGHAETVPDRD